MSRFSYGNKQTNAGDNLPLAKRIKRALFNAKVALFRDEQNELSSVHLSDRVLK